VLDNNHDVKVVYAKEIFIGDKHGERELPNFSLKLLARKNMIPNMALYRNLTGKSRRLLRNNYRKRRLGILDFSTKRRRKVVKLPCIGLYYRIRPNSKRMTDRKLKKHVY
jgi:hypothetical protein